MKIKEKVWFITKNKNIVKFIRPTKKEKWKEICGMERVK